MAIKDRIKRIEKYFKEMQVATMNGKQVIYVIVNFPSNWIVDDELAAANNVLVSAGNKIGEYYFCADIEDGEGVIFDVIEKNIEKMKEAVERAQLLSSKTLELKDIFEDESIPIENLRLLKFVYDKPTRKYTKKKEVQKEGIEIENQIENNEINDTEEHDE